MRMRIRIVLSRQNFFDIADVLTNHPINRKQLRDVIRW